jgi:hypothetical protein
MRFSKIYWQRRASEALGIAGYVENKNECEILVDIAMRYNELADMTRGETTPRRFKLIQLEASE